MFSGRMDFLPGALVANRYRLTKMVGAGGIWAEVLDDVRFLALPASPDEITRALDSLRIAPILRGARGQAPLDVPAAVAAEVAAAAV